MCPNLPRQAYGSTADSGHRSKNAQADRAPDLMVKISNTVAVTSDEETTLLRREPYTTQATAEGQKLTSSVMAILLLGELLSHADTTLIFAAAPGIASELDSLKGIGWLATAYTLGVCSMQPLYGRLSDIFGRKHMLLFAYAVLSFGCVLHALSKALIHIIVARAISGIGGAGVMTMASIIITDSVPRSEFAKYRSYINLVTTLGRGIGRSLGGLVADSMGWQWLFWGRLPFFGLSVVLILTSLKEDKPGDGEERTTLTLREK